MTNLNLKTLAIFVCNEYDSQVFSCNVNQALNVFARLKLSLIMRRLVSGSRIVNERRRKK